MCEVLKRLGVAVMEDCPVFLKSHPIILGTFVQPPDVSGVLQAMEVSSSEMGDGMHSAILLEKVTDDEKRALRRFIAKTQRLNSKEKKVLLYLPIFETTGKSQDFVSKKQGLLAAPADADEFPVSPKRNFIDTQDEDSRRMARLLDITILKPTDYLLEGIFPYVESQTYSNEDIDRLMAFVIQRYDLHIGAHERMKELKFVPTDNARARALDLFDPRSDLLRAIFAGEDVFPVGDQYNDPSVLVVLEKLGMKSDDKITAQDLYRSARKIHEVSSMHAEQKSQAVMTYLERKPEQLQETVNGTTLGDLLREIPWVCIMRQKPASFPRSLFFWGEGEENARFFTPTEVNSAQYVDLVGTVKPIVVAESSSQLAKYFGWNEKPTTSDVVNNLKIVISCYTQEEKLHYMLLVESTYAYFHLADPISVAEVLKGIENSRWIWNGDGFSSPSAMLAVKPALDLSPYISCLPPEMTKHKELFLKFGIQTECDATMLLSVLGLMKEKYDNGKDQFEPQEVKRDLQLSIAILNEVQPNDGDQLPPQLQEKVLIPTYVKGDATVKLAPVKDCMYCEGEWVEPENDEEGMDHFFVHPYVSSSTAEMLNVRTLINSMLDPDELTIGEEFGQQEKLTDRLNRLLEDYTDGFAVAKELIQNADDAGATEVRFLYDERTNEDAMNRLIDEGMKGCQGPALWVYNDAVFQDEDFVNITKLNGGTKEQETEKIGKFGLGFNAVYNLTDVPMFLSRNYFVIFDPSTCYLRKAIRDKSKPGMKIDINRNTKRLRNFRNQFKPFSGIFDCDLRLEKEDNSFEGTLFRLPLRTKEQAERSEIKKLCYSDQEMRKLLEMFLDKAKVLLLFTQNVIRVEIYHLQRSSSETPQPELLFQVSKSISQGRILRKLSPRVILPATAKKLDAEQRRLLEQSNYLQACSRVKKFSMTHNVDPKEFPKSSIAVNIDCILTNSGLQFFDVSESRRQEHEYWLVVSSMGNGQAMQLAKSKPSLLPSAGVAVRLMPEKSDTFLPMPVTKKANGLDCHGTIFCYLPLPIYSGLPVHINGAFAVTSNRRRLHEKLEDDKECIEVKWNSTLMEDSVSCAYISLLEDVKSLAPDDDSYAFHLLWPKVSEVDQGCLPVLSSFYQKLVSKGLDLFCDGNEWVSITRVVFLHPNLRADPNIGEASFTVFQHLAKVDDVVIDVPAEVYQSFIHCGLKTFLERKTFDKGKFFCEVFFPNIADVCTDLRDLLVLHALDDGNFDEAIKSHACIPTSHSRKILKRPSQLVNPKKDVASLFCLGDGRFPAGDNTFETSMRLEKLEHLGMIGDDLPWEQIVERAEIVQRLFAVDRKAATKRVSALLKFMEKKLKRQSENPSQPVLDRLSKAKFLPVLQKPDSFPLSWKGDTFLHSNKPLVSPKEIFLKKNRYLVCCTEPLADREIPEKVKEFLKLEEKEVTAEHVMRQLDYAISTDVDNLSGNGFKELRRVCKEAYSFLQDNVVNCTFPLQRFQEIFNKRFVLVEKRFLFANQVAFEVKADCSPYLYKLPEHLSAAFYEIFKLGGVRKEFEPKDYISSLQEVKEKFLSSQLDEETLQAAINMANLLGETLERSGGDSSQQEEYESVCLPDSQGIMRCVVDLCSKDCPWMPDDPEEHFVHEKIPWSICNLLGVKTRRQEALQQHDVGFPFGQKEKLTNRLKRILTGYPGEKEILKELLQNADDAQATEICFVKDPRHHSDKKVFDDRWKPLQGPALCVYNNKPFTEADIKGICNLGEGSKGDDVNKTGQYGVGFNAVYHLTDVPSFISRGDEIGDVLCVFDPHCKYVPHSSHENPGRMFKDIQGLKRKFPDVFPCYLENCLPISNATLFRLPLRTKKMAKESQISQNSVTVEQLDTMIEDLKKELFEVLLFVNNVKKISISEVDKMGTLVQKYFVQVILSADDERKRQEFSHYMKEVGKQAKEKYFLPSSISVKRCTYTLKIQDSLGQEEKWLIVQQVGFEKPIEESIIIAFKENQLRMLPRGGVACLLESQRLDSRVEEKKKAFCFLPLPFETELPVHINGHFALDYETRRYLWRDEVSGYRSDWNNALLCDVISSCYLTLLDKVRVFHQLPVSQHSESSNPAYNRSIILTGVSSYEKLFPMHPIEDPHWRTLANSVYKEMAKKEMHLIPVVKRVSAQRVTRSKASTTIERAQLAWFPPTGLGKDRTYFNNLENEGCFAALPQSEGEKEENWRKREDYRNERRWKFEETLLETGFNLVSFSLAVFHSFREAEVEVFSVSPSNVMDFYKSFDKTNPLCNVGPIPCHVSKTPFKNQEGVIHVLTYCKDDEHFVENLPGLPLLLTENNHLNAFSESDPKCLSPYQDILPFSPSIFVHKGLRMPSF